MEGAASNLARLMAELDLADYRDLHAWSVADRPAFWGEVVRRLGIVFAREPDSILLDAGDPEHARWLPGAELNIADSCFAGDPGRAAVVTPDGVTTVGELERLANQFARGLLARGLGPSDGVALYMPMTLECVAAYLGTVRAGAYVVSIADSFPAPEVERRIGIGNAKLVVTVAELIRAGKRIPLYGTVREADAPPAVVIPPASGRPALRPGDVLWEDFLGDDELFPSAIGDPERTTNVLFSSGTTGTPKAIPWTHLTPIKCAMDGHFHQDLRPGDVAAWPTNIGWMMGPWLVYAALVNRAAIALWPGAPTEPGFVEFVGRAGVTMLGLVPTIVRAWRASGAAGGVSWPRLRVFSSTGEPSNRDDYAWLMGLAGNRAPVIEYCGGTEIGGGYITGTVVQPAVPATFTTPALGLDLVVLDGEGREVAEGESGEVFLVPPSIGLSSRLLNADHHAIYYEGCPTGPRGETLRRHGDEMTLLPGGRYRAEGRADDTMNLGGIKVSSLEIERVLAVDPAVLECAAVAVRPASGGPERLVIYAAVEGEPDRAEIKREMAVSIKERLNPLLKIHDLVLVASLPRTASGKLVRRSLRDRYLRETRGP